MDSIRVAIVDDDGLIRDGLTAILETCDDIVVTGSAADGRTGVDLCLDTTPDVVLLDIRMPVMDGVEATTMIREKCPDARIIILTTFNDVEYIANAMSTGAAGYLLKSSPADAIIESVRAVYRGNTVLQNEVAERLKTTIRPPRNGSSDEIGLAPREFEILRLIAEGLSNKEIAATLDLSDGTVRNYVSGMLEKLDVRDRTQLAIFFYRNLA